MPRIGAALLVGALLAAAGSDAALAQGPLGGGRDGGMRWGAGRGEGELALMIRAANLTPEQQTRVREILSATHFVTDLTLGLGEVVHDYLAKA